MSPSRAYYYALKSKFPIKFRVNVVDPVIAARGERFRVDGGQIRQEQKARAAKVAKPRRTAQEMDVPIPRSAADPDELQEGLDWEKEERQERNRQQDKESTL